MATTAIGNVALSGAIAGLLESKAYASADPAGYATIVSQAGAFKTAFLAANAALADPLADGDDASMYYAIAAICAAALADRGTVSVAAADYAKVAASAAAASRAAVSAFVVA